MKTHGWIPRPNVRGPPLVDREMISTVSTMIVAYAVLGNATNVTGHRHLSSTLMKVDLVIATAHTVDVKIGYNTGPRTVPNSAPLWCIVVKTVMALGTVHLAPAVPVSSKETDIVGQCLW